MIQPNEFLETETHPHDPIEDFNVYGYGGCCCASANVEGLTENPERPKNLLFKGFHPRLTNLSDEHL